MKHKLAFAIAPLALLLLATPSQAQPRGKQIPVIEHVVQGLRPADGRWITLARHRHRADAERFLRWCYLHLTHYSRFRIQRVVRLVTIRRPLTVRPVVGTVVTSPFRPAPGTTIAPKPKHPDLTRGVKIFPRKKKQPWHPQLRIPLR